MTPPLTGVLTIFYYKDAAAAAAWYDTLGFECIRREQGLILFRIQGEAMLALVAEGHGSQRPLEGREKGAILSLQTSDLDRCFEILRLRGVTGEARIHWGYGGRTREFKLYDPEGYTVEYFEWATAGDKAGPPE